MLSLHLSSVYANAFSMRELSLRLSFAQYRTTCRLTSWTSSCLRMSEQPCGDNSTLIINIVFNVTCFRLSGRITTDTMVIVCGWRRKSTSVLGIFYRPGGPTTFIFLPLYRSFRSFLGSLFTQITGLRRLGGCFCGPAVRSLRMLL